ncbi:MAG: ABC transporter permease [Bacillota bacterium]
MKYFIRKTGWLLFAILIALLINFILPRLMPGDPAQIIVNRLDGADSANLEAIRTAFGVETDRNIILQFGDYLGNVAQGDLGVSISHYPTPVWNVLRKALPWTIGLIGLATIISFIIGTFIGIFVGWYRKSKISDAIIGVFLFIRSFPYFWLGLILVYFFAFERSWFPLGGARLSSVSWADKWEFIKSVTYHGILPAFTITISSLGYWLLTIRNNMINVLAEDYITVARAKGLSTSRIRNMYAARNAILPSISGFAMALGFIVGGSLITEIVFSYPGVGFMLYQAIQQQDYPLLQAIFLFITLGVLVANFLADIAIMALDPRVRDGDVR